MLPYTSIVFFIYFENELIGGTKFLLSNHSYKKTIINPLIVTVFYKLIHFIDASNSIHTTHSFQTWCFWLYYQWYSINHYSQYAICLSSADQWSILNCTNSFIEILNLTLICFFHLTFRTPPNAFFTVKDNGNSCYFYLSEIKQC